MTVKKKIEGLDEPVTTVAEEAAAQAAAEIQAQKDRAAESNAELVKDEATIREKEVEPTRLVEAAPVATPSAVLPVGDVVANLEPTPLPRDDAAQIELLAHNRFVIGDRLFERGIVYDMTEEDAKVLLRIRADDGRPMFARYEMEAKLTNDRIVRRAPKPQLSQTAKPIKAVADAGPSSKIIEIGTEEELIAAGLVSKDAAEVIAANADKGPEAEL